MKDTNVIGIVYNARVPQAVNMAGQLGKHLERHHKVWLSPAHEVEFHKDDATNTGLIITVGGDGTILRAVRVAALEDIPLLGINLGRLGFMTELKSDEAIERLPLYLAGQCWTEERAMLQAQIQTEKMHQQHLESSMTTFHALNDVVVGRGAVSRLVRIRTSVDGAHLTTYRADAVIVATATGSTGYNLSVGGPILFSHMKEMVLKPVACHLGLSTAVVLPASSVVEMTVESEGHCMVSVDGYMDLALSAGDTVVVKASPYTAKFLRFSSPSSFYETLTKRLSIGQPSSGNPGAK